MRTESGKSALEKTFWTSSRSSRVSSSLRT
jgi:hypothetical protein